MLPASLRTRWQNWWLARLPLTDQLTLTQGNVYILPTRAGWMLALTLLVLLIASINFQLNLGYLLTFLLTGSATASVYLCHGTLRGMQLHLTPPDPQFLGTPATLQIQLHNSRTTPRLAVSLAIHGSNQWAWADVPAQGSCTVQVAFTATHRGLQRAPVLAAQTLYPLGIFRVWALWRPQAQVLIYPRPEVGAPALPPGQPHDGRGHSTSMGGMNEFDGVRAYRQGDPLKQVLWKKAAKALATGSGDLVSRDHQRAQRDDLWLDGSATGMPDTEARIARLTAWVLQADRLGLTYGLRLPGLHIPQGHGAAQRLCCLEALALY